MIILSGKQFEIESVRSRKEQLRQKWEEEERSVQAIAQFMASEKREIKP